MHYSYKNSTDKTRRIDINPALSIDLMERILSKGNMKRAWQQVKRNHGTSGVDGMTLDEFPKYARCTGIVYARHSKAELKL